MEENVSGCFFLNTVYNVNSMSILYGGGPEVTSAFFPPSAHV